MIGAIKSLTAVSRTFIANYSHFESLQTGLETFFQSADKGKAKFEELRKMSNETTFGVDELTSSFTQLANVGVAVDTINDKLLMLGNISGGSKEKFADLVTIYAKIMSTGKAGSMQIQQLATRGVPIYDMLKKIGVQGQATGEQVTKALEEMTKEGGQFYGAMENINKTIEGKEGFISDYFKEFTVNFAELTGIAETYKGVLDVLKEGIGLVSDKLLEWNQNPVMKAIIQGSMVTILTGIAGVVVGSIIPALALVKAKLAEIAVLKGIVTGSWVGLAVGAVAGIGVGIYSIVKHQRELKEETKKANDELREQLNIVGKPSSRSEDYENAKNLLANYEDMKKKQQELKTSLEADKVSYMEIVNSWLKNKGEYSNAEYYEAKANLDNIDSKIQDVANSIVRADNLIAEQKGLVGFYENLKGIDEQYSILSDTFAKLYSQTPNGKNYLEKSQLASQITELKKFKELEGQNGMGGVIKFDDKTRSQIDETIAYLQKKLDELNLGKPVEKVIPTWQKVFEDVTGVSVGSKAKSGYFAGSDYRAKMIESMEYDFAISKALGGGEEGRQSVLQQYINQIESDIKDLLHTSEIDEAFTLTDDSIVEMVNYLNYLKSKLGDVNEEIKDTNESLSEWIVKMKKGSTSDQLKGYGTELVLGASSDINNAVVGFEQGGVIGAVINVIASNLLPLLQEISPVLSPVKYLLESLTPVIEAIGLALSPIAMVFKAISNLINNSKWAKKLKGYMDEVNSYLSDTSSNLRDVNEQFKTLNSVLKENAEYYLQEKQRINGETYSESVYKVNDMILTSQGRFSTSPEDTIIAMKHPENLAGGRMLQPIINNYAGADVSVEQRDNNGITELIVNISKSVAKDFAEGKNGWDSASNYRQNRLAGKRVL